MFVFGPKRFPDEMDIGGFIESILNKDTYLDKCLMIEVNGSKTLFYRENIVGYMDFLEDEVWIKAQSSHDSEAVKELKKLLNTKLEEWISHINKTQPKVRYVTVSSHDLQVYKWELIQKTPNEELRELLKRYHKDPDKLKTCIEEVVQVLDKVIEERKVK